ncbi:hypothetical protein [Sporosarcina sp. FA9]|uniref:hypothetical protein n=1 Tax=Sporosarcina sp. FA9 TaxID=3413030 RepID=UPI003F6609FC
MKKDMRITYPLWMMGFIFLIGVSIFYVAKTSVVESNGDDVTLTFMIGTGSNIIAFSLISIILLTTVITFFVRMLLHNRKNPERKIPFVYWKPPEYIDDDELFQQATGRATRKVYTFFVTAIPFLFIIYISLPIGKLWMAMGVLFLGFMQYLIYYKEIRKYVSEEE